MATLDERAAEGARKLSEAERARNAEADEWELKERKRRAEWLERGCTPPRLGWRGLFRRPKPDVDGERMWLASLPFRVLRYEELFHGKLLQLRWAVRLRFAGAEPDDTLLQRLFANVLPETSVGHVDMPGDRRDPYGEMKLPEAIDASYDRRWHMRGLFHRVVDEVALPLHAEYPITEIEPGDDHVLFTLTASR